jgi:hypothetical protein
MLPGEWWLPRAMDRVYHVPQDPPDEQKAGLVT